MWQGQGRRYQTHGNEQPIFDQQEIAKLLVKSQMQRLQYTKNLSPHQHEPSYSPGFNQKKAYSPLQSKLEQINLKPINQTAFSPLRIGTIQQIYQKSPNRVEQGIIQQDTIKRSPAYYQKKYASKSPVQTQSQSLFIQILQPSRPPLPDEIQRFLQNPSIMDFQDFISQSIYKHIIANDNKYTPEQNRQFQKVDLSHYRLSEIDQQSQDLKKSVSVMLNHYLQFLVHVIEYLGNTIEGKQQANNPSGQNQSNASKSRYNTQQNNDQQSTFFDQLDTTMKPQTYNYYLEQTKHVFTNDSGVSDTSFLIKNSDESKAKTIITQQTLSNVESHNYSKPEESTSLNTKQLQEKASRYASQIGSQRQDNPMKFKSFNLQKKVYEFKKETDPTAKEEDYIKAEPNIVPVRSSIFEYDKKDLMDVVKTNADSFLKLIFDQGQQRADREFKENSKSSKISMIPVSLSNLQQSGLSFGKDDGFLEPDEDDENQQTFDPALKQKIYIPSDEDSD